MKIFTKTKSVAGAEAVGETETYDIPNTTIAYGSLILAIIQAVATILGTYIGNWPKHQVDKASIELREKNFKVQLLQRVLEIDDTIGRANSLKLLIASGLLNSELSTIANQPSNVPKWIKRPLETVNADQTHASSITSSASKPVEQAKKDTGDLKGKPATEPM